MPLLTRYGRVFEVVRHPTLVRYLAIGPDGDAATGTTVDEAIDAAVDIERAAHTREWGLGANDAVSVGGAE